MFSSKHSHKQCFEYLNATGDVFLLVVNGADDGKHCIVIYNSNLPSPHTSKETQVYRNPSCQQER